MAVNRKMKRFNAGIGEMKKSIRLSDVARAAGVSLGTASNTFNRPDLVRREAREMVETAARRLGYSGPDPIGRLLMGAKAHAIGVLPPGDISVAHAIGSPFFSDFLRGVGEVCDDHGASLVIVSGAEDRRDWAIRNALVDGFILGHAAEVELVSSRQGRVSLVVMDMDAGPNVSSVRIDGRSGARAAAEHLLNLGHRCFAILSVLRRRDDLVWHPRARSDRQLVAAFPLDHEKLLGYGDALSAAGISMSDVPMVECHPASPWAEAGARMLLDSAPEATAILAMSDKHGIAVLNEARRRGIHVPLGLSVVGFDDAPDAFRADPALTTVAQPTVEKGRVAARTLFEQGPPRHEVLPVKLIVRSSTAPPRS